MNNELAKKPSLFDYILDEINNEELQCDVSDDGKCLNDVCMTSEENISTNYVDTNLNETKNSCDIMLKAFDDAFETIYGDNEVNFVQVQRISEELQTNCIHLINMIKTQKDSKDEIEQLKSKCTLLDNESLTTINKLQCQITELNLQLKQQSTFNSIIGSTLGYYLWKATKIPSVVDIVLQEDKIANMAKLMISTLTSFIDTYKNNMPSIKTFETKFVLNILGIVANLTTTKGGCHFFSQINDGIEVVNLIVALVPFIPPSLENNLKKIAYAALYNVSIQFNGHLLMENNNLIETLHNDIKSIPISIGINDTLLFALKLLHSLTRNINDSMYIILKKNINLQEILKFTRYLETELTARKIYENINIATEKYDDKF